MEDDAMTLRQTGVPNDLDSEKPGEAAIDPDVLRLAAWETDGGRVGPPADRQSFRSQLTAGEDVVDPATWAGSVPPTGGIAPRSASGSNGDRPGPRN